MASLELQRTHKRKRYQLEEEDRNISLQTRLQTAFENTLDHHPVRTENSCAYCSREIPVTNASSLQRGQHISLRSQSTAGFGKPYRHHAIVKETISCVGNITTLRLIHFEKQKGKIKIYDSIESYDLTIHELRIITYIHPRYSPEKIIRRAEQVLNECGEGKFANYNMLTCNCEDFATWCVVGKEESFQVQTLRVVIENILKYVFGGNSKITKFVLKALFLSSDEIASAMTSSTATPVGLLVGSVVAYFIYCIYFTVSLCKQYFKDRAICKSCLRKQLVKLWVQFSVYIGTSSLTFYVLRYVLPLLTPAAGIPLMVLLLVVSTALFIIIPLIK
ncbi:hypothetical protein ACJMK2_029121 [Sinanodonta woodiana]|uniref:LRAT domain-containing protein n=1 Tax=Sinanodonta woodiana TaxID=1069815 RepID=A0ABD3X9N3_SINWO